ncbi:MAG: hypothetical protein MUE37_04655 [Bacteroidales bacterium]|jgi:hypothetical protein|nr:hypothetical protein [Bacteroidales bacterium]
MYKAWIFFTSVSAVFFLSCLGIALFQSRPVLEHYWEEGLLVVSVLNLVIAYIFYRNNRDEFRNRMSGGKN